MFRRNFLKNCSAGLVMIGAPFLFAGNQQKIFNFHVRDSQVHKDSSNRLFVEITYCEEDGKFSGKMRIPISKPPCSIKKRIDNLARIYKKAKVKHIYTFQDQKGNLGVLGSCRWSRVELH